ERYWIWYEPAWYRGLEAQEALPVSMVIYDREGREIAPRQIVPPRPGLARDITPRAPPPAQPSPFQAWCGLVAPPIEAAVLVGTKRFLDSRLRENDGAVTWPLYQFLVVATAHFIPGVRWLPRTHPGLIFGFAALMSVGALACALGCFTLAR